MLLRSFQGSQEYRAGKVDRELTSSDIFYLECTVETCVFKGISSL